MKDWEKFRTFKERGEWVELLFMADAASHGYHVLKPCGDSLEYDVAVEHAGDLIRVQVKSSTARKGYGYLCRLRHGVAGERRYSPENVDLFAIYVIPAKAWYLIPAATVLRPKPKMHIRFYPHGLPRRRRGRHDEAHDYEHCREAWHLLSKTPRELSKHKRWEPKPNGFEEKAIPARMVPVPLGTADNSPPVHWQVRSRKTAPVPAARLNRSTTPKSVRLRRKHQLRKPALSEVAKRQKNTAQGASPG